MSEPSIMRLRKQLPPLVFIVIALLCLLVIGFACVCASDHPGQAIERVVSSIPSATPASVEVWSMIVLALLSPMVVLRRRMLTLGRASPAELQRFLL